MLTMICRAQVLKQMLEGYLNQSSKAIPDLQQQANTLAREVLSELPLPDESGESTPTARRSPVSKIDEELPVREKGATERSQPSE